MKQLRNALASFAGFNRKAARGVLAAVILVMVTMGFSVNMDAAQAAGLKLKANCDSLNSLDVTTVENPSCEAASAVYFDADGNMLYIERLKVDDKREVTGRLVRVIKACKEDDDQCSGGCGRAGCFVCVGRRCGCIC